MMNIDIEVPSSSRDATYIVSVGKDDEGVFVSCTCPAGVFGKQCKHKLEVLNASISATDDHLDPTHFEIRRLLENTGIPLLLSTMNRADQELHKAKRVLEAAKRNLEKSLKGASAKGAGVE